MRDPRTDDQASVDLTPLGAEVTVGTPRSPRLQLRWTAHEGPVREALTPWKGQRTWACHYELVIPLDEFDIRRDVYDDGEVIGQIDELVIPIKCPSLRTSSHEPCTWKDDPLHFDTPFRDGAHAHWDAKLLGNLPVYVVSIGGTYLQERKAARPEQTADNASGRK